MSPKEKALINDAMKAISNDLEMGDFGSIKELIENCIDTKKLEMYLSKEDKENEKVKTYKSVIYGEMKTQVTLSNIVTVHATSKKKAIQIIEEALLSCKNTEQLREKIILGDDFVLDLDIEDYFKHIKEKARDQLTNLHFTGEISEVGELE